MAEGIRISQLPSITAMTDDDVLIVNDGNASTRRITFSNFKTSVTNDIAPVTSVNGQTGAVTIDADSLGVYTKSEVDTNLADYATNTLVGVVNGSIDLGAFSGTTIPDNVSVKGALQALELAVEGGDAQDAILSANNVFTGTNEFQGTITASQNGNIIPFYFDNQAAFPAAASYHGAVAHSHADGAMFYAHGGSWVELANAADITTSVDLTDTYTLIGVAEGETSLGQFVINATYPSSLVQISDNSSIKSALQQLSDKIVTNNQLTIAVNAEFHTLIGVQSGDTNLGTFGGSTITDNVSVKTALGELETALEGVTTFSGSYNDLTDQPTLFSGSYNDLTDTPTLGTAAATDATAYATAAQGTTADSAVQPTADAITVTSLPTDGTATVDTLAAAINTLTTELAAILNA
jgi:hypothetical protein